MYIFEFKCWIPNLTSTYYNCLIYFCNYSFIFRSKLTAAYFAKKKRISLTLSYEENYLFGYRFSDLSWNFLEKLYIAILRSNFACGRIEMYPQIVPFLGFWTKSINLWIFWSLCSWLFSHGRENGILTSMFTLPRK